MRKWLKDIRRDRPQGEIAEMAGITQQMYSWIERGERTPSVNVAKRIAAVMGFDWILFYEDEQAAAKETCPQPAQEVIKIDAGYFKV